MKLLVRRFLLPVSSLVILASCLTSGAKLAAQQAAGGIRLLQEGEDASFHRTWQIGTYASGGFAPDYHVGCICIFRYQKEQEFYTATIEAGRMLTSARGPHILEGRAEVLAEVTPFWLTHSPAQENIIYSNDPFFNGAHAGFAPYSIHGISFTPMLFRWNFINHNAHRHIPWLQAGAGVLWTAKRFPQGGGYPGSNTSVFNFTPQLGAGENLYVKKNQSLNLGVRVVQYNNAGLGEINPGILYTLHFSVGYSWWK